MLIFFYRNYLFKMLKFKKIITEGKNTKIGGNWGGGSLLLVP